jgi:hypothetical protein
MPVGMPFAIMLVLAAGDPTEWSTFPSGKPQAPAQQTQQPTQKQKQKPTQAQPQPEQPQQPPSTEWSSFPTARSSTPAQAPSVPPEALDRYRAAIADISAGRYTDATSRLNDLSGEFPRVAEIFAARCSAQLGLRQAQYAEADCAYALQLKPSLSNARFGLAEAEEGLGKRDLALRHYREFINDPAARADLKGEAAKRADGVTRGPAAAGPVGPVHSAKPQCLVGKNGRQACGYNCMLGSDGIAACADMPEGDCVKGEDGHVTCAQIAVRGGANAGGQVPECKAGMDGIKVCGYHCKQGTNGRMYCAAKPEGECTQNSDGTFSCQ